SFRRNKNEKLNIFTPLVFTFCIFFINVIRYIKEFFGSVSVESVIFQMTMPWDGTGEIHSLVAGALRYVMSVIIFSGFAFVLLNTKRYGTEIKTSKTLKNIRFTAGAGRLRTVFMLVFTIIYSEYNFGIIKFVTNSIEKSTLYEEYYIDKDDIDIVFPENKRNLVMIYLESMEVSYTKTDKENTIPNLTKLAENEISFSNTEGMGGFYEAYGCKWTMGALLGSSSGIPYNIPVGGNAMVYYSNFLPGLDTNLGHILEENGYENVFMCGSDIAFGGRDKYFSQHGNYKLMDYYTAIDDGYIDKDYYVWWGHEDEILVQRAKDEILRLAEGDRPFNFTMLTVDTHFEDGYECNLCENHFEEQYSNVIRCSDKLIYEFVQWLQQQDFYENTTVVLVGDHTTMDTDYTDDIEEKRTVYNCFMNVDADTSMETKNRLVTTLDIFPSVLGAMGVEIEGDRIALGTNLFSGKETLAEELGLEYFQDEMAKSSDYYNGFLQQ
ncbi:MAG: LTA synthase family protein, partial [Oscillospiraceae bacterium]|nr:LTA synthase family protein [Oscillospiraceae bacterium]